MILQTAAFVIGALLLQFQAELLDNSLSLLLLPLAVIIWLFRKHPFIQLPALFLVGFLWASLHAHQLLSTELIPDLEGVDLQLTGVISSLPEVSPDRTRFEFNVKKVSQLEELNQFPRRLLLSWYSDAPRLAVGETWQLWVRLKRPHGLSNPGGFDYEQKLFQSGIRATGYIRVNDDNSRLKPTGNSQIFNRLREQVGERIAEEIGGQPFEGIVRALIIGDRSLITPAQWEHFRSTGTNHLMAISGLHIGIVSGLFFFVGSWVWRRTRFGCYLLPASHAGAIAALLAGFCYAGLAGFAIPCVRALVMLVVVMIGVLFRRTLNPVQILCCALFLVVLIDPFAVISSGFWLSFGAVIVIMLGMQNRVATSQNRLLPLIRVQWVVSLGLAPVLLLFGFDLPLISPVVNIIMVPLFSLLLVPLLLLSVMLLFIWPPLGSLLLSVAVWVITQVEGFLAWLAMLCTSFAPIGEPPLWLILGIILAMLLLLMPAGIPGRVLALPLLLPLFLIEMPAVAPGMVRLTMLDVGQGLSVVVQTAHHVLLYDAGPSYPSGFDTGKLVVVPYLQFSGIKHIDRVIISNGDSDHRGGLAAVLQHFPVGELQSGEPHRLSVGTPIRCVRGFSWEWDGVQFEILHPDESNRWRGNNASCVVAIRNRSGQILLTGDIEAEAEAALVARYQERLGSLVVTVPHHGSATSSGSAFVNRTHPQYGLISAGYRNRYKFPREVVLRNWADASTSLFNTAETGAISIILASDGTLQSPASHRLMTRRYWMSPPL